MRTSELVVNTEPTPDEVQYLEDRLYEFNSAATGITDGELLAIFVRDDKDRIVAGICGNTWGGCLEIRQLWVDEAEARAGDEAVCRSRTRSSATGMPADSPHHLHVPGAGLLRQARLRGLGHGGRPSARLPTLTPAQAS